MTKRYVYTLASKTHALRSINQTNNELKILYYILENFWGQEISVYTTRTFHDLYFPVCFEHLR